MARVIFICRGNMFRSQVADALYKSRGGNSACFGTAVEVEEREGIKLRNYRDLDGMIAAMKNMYGIDMSERACSQIHEADIDEGDMIIAMAEEAYIPQWLQEKDCMYWQVENPISANEEKSLEIIKEIEKMVFLLPIIK